jgi:hypothetical protein
MHGTRRYETRTCKCGKEGVMKHSTKQKCKGKTKKNMSPDESQYKTLVKQNTRPVRQFAGFKTIWR